MIVLVCLIGLFIILGIIMSMGKGSFLIAGFNTMSKDEKEKYDKMALCKFMGKMMFAFAFSMTLCVLRDIFEIEILFSIGIILYFVVIVFALIYSNTGNRFKRKI